MSSPFAASAPRDAPRVAVAGPGRLGRALARLLAERGANVVALAGRHRALTLAAAAFAGARVRAAAWEELPALADHILLTVPDDALSEAADRLARAGMRDGVVLHCSGASSVASLAALSEAGVACGVLHPLQTIPTCAAGLERLPGCVYAVIAEGAAAEWALDLVKRLDGHSLRIAAADQPRYHAAAALASNGIAALLDAAVILMGQAGIARDDALDALAPLVRAATENTLTLGPVEALTGPVERNDAGTIAAHLAALDGDATIRELYRAASRQLCDLARRKHPHTDYRGIETMLEKGSPST